VKIKEELGVDVELIHGKYGEYKVLVDGEVVLNGGARVVMGLFPSIDSLVKVVRDRVKA
jgi:hypothetical protein